MNNIKLNIETQDVHLEEIWFSEEEILLLKWWGVTMVKVGVIFAGTFSLKSMGVSKDKAVDPHFLLHSTDQ